MEAKKFAAEGYTIVLIGHEGHEEVEGTMGEAPDHFVLVETEDDVDRLELPDPDRVAFLTQTTLSVDETDRIIRRLRERFPNITGPKSDDICYATTNRQLAVRQMAGECDLVLVIGSRNSSNSNRLVEVARDHGAESHLIDNESQVQEEWLEGKRVVGISSGASAPEELVQRLIAFFRERGTSDVSEFEVVQEDVRFMLPKEIRKAAGGTGVNCTPCRRSPGDSASTVPIHLVEARLHAALRERRVRSPRAVAEARGRAGVGRRDPVLAVGPVAHQLEPAAVRGQ